MMKKTALVSVLMTAYNREKYISVAIKSVLQSTYTFFELIIVDDRSTDNTVFIANELALQDSRIRVYINDKNLGDYPNRNKAASYATGKYLKYVDSDDYIYPWTLEIMVNNMEQFPEAGWGLCSMEPNDERPFPFELSPKEAYEYHYLGPTLFKRAPLSSIIKRDVFIKENGFKSIRMAGDFEMWQRLALKYNLVLMSQGLVWYRRHDAQEVNDYRKFINIYEEIRVSFLNSQECPLDKNTIATFKKKERNKIARHILSSLVKLDYGMLKINLRNFKIYQS